MSAQEIIKLVCKRLTIKEEKVFNSNAPESIDAKYIMITIMLEENIPFWEIIEACKIHRTTFLNLKKTINERLGKDKVFTNKYIACEAALNEILEKEEQAW